MMSFTTKFCSTLISSSLRLPCCIGTRNFHFMVKPISQSISAGINSAFTAGTMSVSLPTTSTSNVVQKLLTPFNTILSQVAGFKVKGRLKRRCKDCYFVIRHQRHYVICPTHPRHKQMSMKQRDYKSWILTHATQSKVRPY